MSSFAWNDREVRSALELGGGDPRRRYRGISTDTRTLRPGHLFVALAGDRFDGHDFIGEAIRAGCGGVVAERAPAASPIPCYRVGDTLQALGDLARHRRRATRIPVVAITGSSGKTTTKDLTAGALSPRYRVHTTLANDNNRVGAPLTILALPADATAVVLELGTNEPGEIAALARIAEPTVAVITTISETHIERLGDFGGVLAEKLDLLRGLGSGGRAVVGDEPPELARAARRIDPGVAVSGWSQRADPGLRVCDAGLRGDGSYAFAWGRRRVEMRIPGAHNVANALQALAVARILGVGDGAAARGVSGVGPAPMRGEVRRIGGLTLLLDCYNANAAGTLAAVRTLAEMDAPGRRVAVLGTMLELGERSHAIHAETLSRVLHTGIDRFVLTGNFAHAARRSPRDQRIHLADDIDDLAARLPALTRSGDTVLFKASRGVGLERALGSLEAR